jgi:hypothetical protein
VTTSFLQLGSRNAANWTGSRCPARNGSDDPSARQTRDAGYYLGQFDVHLFESFLHVLSVAGGIADLHLPLPVVATQGHNRIGGAEGRQQQAVAVQPLDPLGVEHVGLGTSTAAGQLARLDQPDLEATRLQQLKQRDPVNACRFQGDRSDPALSQPIGDGFQVAGIGPEATDIGRL